jgi:hypothetical protein
MSTDRTTTPTADAAPREATAVRSTADATPTADVPRRGPDGLLTDPAAARAEARRGWFMLTSMFVAGGILVVIAALAT